MGRLCVVAENSADWKSIPLVMDASFGPPSEELQVLMSRRLALMLVRWESMCPR